jgi:hypothetical protein
LKELPGWLEERAEQERKRKEAFRSKVPNIDPSMFKINLPR